MTEVTRKASVVVADLEKWLAGGDPTAITKAHGWPEPDAVKDNITWLRRLGDATVTFTIPTSSTSSSTSRKEADTMPTPTPPPARPTAAPAPDTIANLLAAAHQHDKPAIRKTAERVDALLARLRADIKADREDAVRRKEIRELEEKLRELKGTKPKRKSGYAPGSQPVITCDECGKECNGPGGLALHKRRAASHNTVKAAS